MRCGTAVTRRKQLAIGHDAGMLTPVRRLAAPSIEQA
jgi:hypothetical protein